MRKAIPIQRFLRTVMTCNVIVVFLLNMRFQVKLHLLDMHI